jgi:sugar phosphate isomerase/epimerase
MDKISIASYAFHGLLREGKMDVFGYLESCRYRYGVQADIWNGMLASTDEDYLRKIRDALDERELELANLCVDGAHIWEDDPAARERNYQNALAHLRAAEILGARTVRIDAGGPPQASEFTSEQFDLVVQRYREFARRGSEQGYRVGPENHWGPERVPANMRQLCQALDSPGFGVLLHIGGWNEPDAERGDEYVLPWVMHTHVAWNITETCLPQKMAMLRDAGYDGYWGVEHHSGESEYTEVAIQVARVRDVLHRWRVGGGQP